MMVESMINDVKMASKRRSLAAKNTNVILTDGKKTIESCYALHANSYCTALCKPLLI